MTDLKDKLEKLIWMALDQGGNENQMDQAAAAMFRLLRKQKVDAKSFFALFGGTFSNAPPPSPPGLRVKMPFGKFKGRTLGQIAELQIDYLEWCLENIKRMSTALRVAMIQTLEHYQGVAS